MPVEAVITAGDRKKFWGQHRPLQKEGLAKKETKGEEREHELRGLL